MSALFIMRYVGAEGVGAGVLYVGHGVLLGADQGNGRYTGTYTQEDGRLRGEATLTAGPGDADLVTGRPLAQGQSIALQADWPAHFWDGSPQHINVAGQSVAVTFEKIGDLP